MDDMSERDQAMLSEWVRDAFDAAVHAGYISPPWKPSAAMRNTLQSYYVSGLNPAEAAQALFATRQ
ncbi:hypothetical protein [Paraburkholderia caffeinilytica]|uniref:hypothetical protein n=1 Tax=Paraburkholderia caffeinilytica TaxID=1761016 RepID=UPI0038BAD481